MTATEDRPADRPRRGNRLVLVAVLLAVAAAAVAGWFHLQQGRQDGRADQAGRIGGGVATPPAAGGASAGGAAAGAPSGAAAGATAGAGALRSALTITVERPRRLDWAISLPANGSITAWQEVSISAEVAGLRLADVQANVGDRVQRGQVLATLSPSAVANDLAQQQAVLAEAQAGLAEAAANAERARKLQDSGAISAQQINQYLTAERTARARLQAIDARIRTEQLRLSQTQVRAPDDGVIAARSATIGAVAQPGQELFRLIRQGRLEWRAEVPAADLHRVAAGSAVRVAMPDGGEVAGTVRTVAPTIDPQTRNGLVYVDLSAPVAAAPTAPGGNGSGVPAAAGSGRAEPRAGMFARGVFELGSTSALTLSAQSVLLRDGFSYVFRVGPDRKAALTKVGVGRRIGERIEITEGLGADDAVAATGVGFLSDGDLVTVVDATSASRGK